MGLENYALVCVYFTLFGTAVCRKHVLKMLTYSTNPFPVLETERLMLREMTLADAVAFFQIRGNEKAMKYLDRPLATTVLDAIALIEKRVAMEISQTGLGWAITLKTTGEMIGDMGFYRLDRENYKSEIGYIFNPDFWLKGYGTEALKAVLKFGFEILKLNKIEADINPENLASIQLVLKSGFKKEAHLRENLLFEGKFLDSLIFGLLKEDWQKNQIV